MTLENLQNHYSRIAFFLLDLDGGGAERAIVSLANDVASRGYQVDLVVGDANSDYLLEVSPDVNLIDFATRSPFLVVFKLINYIHKQNPDVIMSALDVANIAMIIAARISKYSGRKVVSQRAVLGSSLNSMSVTRRFMVSRLRMLLFPLADAIISNSKAAALEIGSVLKIPEERIVTINNAVNVEKITKLSQKPIDYPSLLDRSVPLVLSIGSLTKRKDMETLIRAFAIVRESRDAVLAILGKGPEQPFLQKLILELGLLEYVKLLGFDVNPYKWLAISSVFVSSSTEEGFPNVIAEALALGRTIVATDCPGDTAELLANGKWGRLVPVRDPIKMAKAILEALDDKDPPNSRIRAEHFSPSRVTSAYLDVLLPQINCLDAMSN